MDNRRRSMGGEWWWPGRNGTIEWDVDAHVHTHDQRTRSAAMLHEHTHGGASHRDAHAPLKYIDISSPAWAR